MSSLGERLRRLEDIEVRTEAGWRYRVERIRFSYWPPLTDGWDAGRYALASAVPPEVGA